MLPWEKFFLHPTCLVMGAYYKNFYSLHVTVYNDKPRLQRSMWWCDNGGAELLQYTADTSRRGLQEDRGSQAGKIQVWGGSRRKSDFISFQMIKILISGLQTMANMRE